MRYSSFRKRTGVFNYKKEGVAKTHKKPGLIDVKIKNDLLKMKKI